MGRKVEMKKIENATRCQVTFSKRRSSLIKKAHEISVFCDIDVAFVAFSPSGRLSKFSSQKRIEDLLERYVNLPADKRYSHILDVEEKQEKLHELDCIKGDGNKLHHLNKQVEHMERQIKMATLELQIYEASLRDFEPDPHHEPSLAQLLWCERNLKDSLNRIMDYQVANEKQDGASFPHNLNGKGQNRAAQNPTHLLMQLDPWISPYSSRVRESIMQELFDHGRKMVSQDNEVIGASGNYTSNLSAKGFSTMQHKMEMPPLARETQTPPSYTQQQQEAYMQGNCAVPIHPYQHVVMLNGSSLEMLGNDKPNGVHQHPTHAFGLQENDMKRLNSVAPNFQLNTINEQPNCIAVENYNPASQNKDAVENLERMLYDSYVYKPLFAPNAADKAIKGDNNDDGPTDQDAIGNDATWTARNKEVDDSSWFWDGFVFPDNLNMEALDIPY